MRDACSRAAELIAGTQSNFGYHQQAFATRDDVEFASAAAKIAFENDEAMLLKVPRRACFGH